MTLPDETLTELARLEKEATAGPWSTDRDGNVVGPQIADRRELGGGAYQTTYSRKTVLSGVAIDGYNPPLCASDADVAFIVATRNALPALLSELTRARAAEAALLECRKLDELTIENQKAALAEAHREMMLARAGWSETAKKLTAANEERDEARVAEAELRIELERERAERWVIAERDALRATVEGLVAALPRCSYPQCLLKATCWVWTFSHGHCNSCDLHADKWHVKGFAGVQTGDLQWAQFVREASGGKP